MRRKKEICVEEKTWDSLDWKKTSERYTCSRQNEVMKEQTSIILKIQRHKEDLATGQSVYLSFLRLCATKSGEVLLGQRKEH